MIDNDLFLSPFGGIDKLSLPKILNIDDRRDDDNEIEVIKGALYRIQILCRRYTFWSYPAGLTIADPRDNKS